jgi:isocitrate/isopropylmalate dehydrogenase
LPRSAGVPAITVPAMTQAMAGAAPSSQILAVRAFAVTGKSAEGNTFAILKSLALDLTFTEFPSGNEGIERYGSRSAFTQALREAIDHSDTTLFGSTNGTTTGIEYLRWGKLTYANVRPARWRPGFRSPLKNPEGIDFVIVRENLEDLYMGIEGDLGLLSALSMTSRLTRKPLDTSLTGKFAIKVITEEATRRVARFACELARKRKARSTNWKGLGAVSQDVEGET